MIPHDAHRYMVERDDACVGWKGVKFYGRPVWYLWLQRAVWEEANGPLPPKSRVNQTCSTHGCLQLEHLGVTTKLPRVPKTRCRKCGGLLSRDKNDKSYCQMCNALRMRTKRAQSKGLESKK